MKYKRVVIIVLLLIVVVFSILAYKNIDKNQKIGNIINLKKEYKEYKSGDYVKINDEMWYVLYDSNKREDYVTLIKTNYIYNENNNIVLNGIYEISDLKKYLENDFIREYGLNKLKEINGYKIRLFNNDDLKKITNYEYDKENDKYLLKECPSYICLNNSFYATMIDTNSKYQKKDIYNDYKEIEDLDEDYKLHIKYYNLSYEDETFVLNSIVDDPTLFIRPIINIYKNAIE